MRVELTDCLPALIEYENDLSRIVAFESGELQYIEYEGYRFTMRSTEAYVSARKPFSNLYKVWALMYVHDPHTALLASTANVRKFLRQNSHDASSPSDVQGVSEQGSTTAQKISQPNS